MTLVWASVAAGKAFATQLPTGEMGLAASKWLAQFPTMAGCYNLQPYQGMG